MDPLNPFAALDAAVSAIVLDAFGISARLLPFIEPGQYGEGRPDLDRTPVDLTVVLSSATETERISGQVRNSSFGGPTQLSGQSMTCWIAADTVHAIGWDIRTNDRVEFPGLRSGYPRRFKVSAMHPTDLGDLELILSEE